MDLDDMRSVGTLENVLPAAWSTVMLLENQVAVTRKGQTTIPARLREKYRIERGTSLQVIETEEGILFKPKKSTLDLACFGSRYGTRKEMKKRWIWAP
jgi:AbrB family looped-hinge helix DNA binding protein